MTICTQDRQCLFGEIIVGAGPSASPNMVINDAASMIQSIWKEIPDHYPCVEIDEFVIMPNHLHGIVVLNGHPQGGAPTLSLFDVAHRFKSLTTVRYRHGVKQNKWHPFPGKLWQRNYYEHVIRNENELNRIRQYIIDNPTNWDKDTENK